ncbi:hypothetical protein FRC06_003408 [Ceratobasidium sp. 370]|nr:hypothetical protein FRC06_003408 [Ceratobasidium sp. 370]
MHLSLVFALAALVGASPAVADTTTTDDSTADSSLSRGCRNPEQRKEWRSFSTAEKAAYIAAVKCLAKKPHTSTLKPQYPRSNLPNMTTASSYYDDLVYVHMDQTDHIHYTGLFLPWHRWYVNEHVTQLKVQCGYQGVMPYWAFVDAAINGYVGDFIGFQNATEKAQAFHPNIHMIMGGDMAGTCPTAAGSSCIGGSTWTANDPLFFLHHANMDRIWYLWQNKNWANAAAFAGGSISTYTDPSYPNGYPPWLNRTSVLPTDGMSSGLKTVQSVMSTTAGDLCYVYV